MDSAMEIARFYDLQYPDEQLVRYLKDEFGVSNDRKG